MKLKPNLAMTNSFPRFTCLLCLLAVFDLVIPTAKAGTDDWPLWRCDAYRSAATLNPLAEELQLSWTRQYSQRRQVWDDPLNHDLMPYDKLLEPIIMDGRMFIGMNDSDKLVALNLDTGELLWEFFTEGPVRLPPAGWQGKVYFTSDDGHLYCVRAEDGSLVWKFRGGPSGRKVIGNERIISAWPARGGPVIRDGQVYFAASIWPFMGTFIYSLDAETGEVTWVNDSTGAQYIKQPHGAPAFAGVAPQGSLVATENVLLVPGGRSVPAAFVRKTGEFLNFHIGGKGTGGSFVCADEKSIFVHTRRRGVREGDLKKGELSRRELNEPILTERGTISFDGEHLLAATKTFEFKVEVDASGDMIRAGDRLYVAGQDAVQALDSTGHVIWSTPVDGNVLRLLAGNGKLVAVTLDGRILVWGTNGESDAIISDDHFVDGTQPHQPSQDRRARAKQIIEHAHAAAGYALWFGLDDSSLLLAMLAESDLRVTATDADRSRVDELRHELDSQGFYGQRCSVHVGDPVEFQAPPYIASLIVVSPEIANQLLDGDGFQSIFESMRPYGGAMWIPVSEDEKSQFTQRLQQTELVQARIVDDGDGVLLFRDGPLRGSADWTHQNADVANTVKSNDQRVKLPLGVLWFGGSSNTDVLPRHGHGPPEQVVGGRTFVEGMNSLSALDTYTGRVLWKREFDDLGTHGIYYDETYKETPLSTEYNQVHIPGSNGRGTNYVATKKEVYMVIGSRCEVMDAETGQTTRQITMPTAEGASGPPMWGYIGIYEDILLGGRGFGQYDGGEVDPSSREGLDIVDMSSSDGLVAFDRASGEVIWQQDARISFLNNGIAAGGGRVYCLDQLPISERKQWLARHDEGTASAARIVSFDVRTGDRLWEHTDDIFGTWLSYSAAHDVVLQAGAAGSDRLDNEVGEGMSGLSGADGTVLWQDLERPYSGPCILYHDLLLTNFDSYKKSSGAFDLRTGEPHLIRNPITGQMQPWEVTRSYGCNSMIASDNLLTFRSGAAGFYDLARQSGTGNFGGFRSGCSSNLVAAGGVLSAPDYTRTCSCTYQNQTSLALVHMPDMEIWTNSLHTIDGPIRRVGINFGAPGDRLSREGTLWLDHPSVGGESPKIDVRVKGRDIRYFRRHPSAVQYGPLAWVGASGVQGAERITIRLTPAQDNDESIPVSLGGNAEKNQRWTVRLYFAEPGKWSVGERLFDVSIQGDKRLANLDITELSGGRLRCIVKEVNGVQALDTIEISFSAPGGQTIGSLLNGVELVAE